MKLFFLLLALLLAYKTHAAERTAKGTIEVFYRNYLNLRGTSKAPTLSFSKSFQKLVQENTQVCRKHAGTNICGWGASGDVYLDAQETDPKLNFKNCGFVIHEPEPGIVEVRLNVYPSIKKGHEAYNRRVTFLMIRENHHWVANEILYNGRSARQELQREIGTFQKK